MEKNGEIAKDIVGHPMLRLLRLIKYIIVYINHCWFCAKKNYVITIKILQKLKNVATRKKKICLLSISYIPGIFFGLPFTYFLLGLSAALSVVLATTFVFFL